MWWKTFYDKSEPSLFLRKNSLGGLWTVGFFVVFCALLGTLGKLGLTLLAVPAALVGVYVFASYLTGALGMSVLSPLVTQAMCVLGWALVGVAQKNLFAALGCMLIMLLCVALLFVLPHARAKNRILVVVEGLSLTGILVTYGYALLNNDFAQTGPLITLIPTICCVATLILSVAMLVVPVLAIAQSVKEDAGATEAIHGVLRLVGLGFVPLVVGTLLSQTNPALGTAAALLCYAALALWAAPPSDEPLGWTLLPLVVVGTLAIVAAAPVKNLPDVDLVRAPLLLVHDGPIGAAATFVAMPLLKGATVTLGPAIVGIVRMGLGMLAGLGAFVQALIGLLVESVLTQLRDSGLPVAVDGDQISGLFTFVWGVKKLPAGALAMQVVGLYVTSFLASVIMGTIRGVVDLRAYADKIGQEQALYEESPVAAGRLAVEALQREILSPHTEVLKDGSQRRLRAALGLPPERRTFIAKRGGWDEQLSGQTVCRPNSDIPPVERVRLKRVHATKVGPGLWWKVFEDDGRMVVVPKGYYAVTLLAVVSVVALYVLVPAKGHASLTIPVLLILMHMAMGHILGRVGSVASTPALVYGWSAIVWHFMSGDKTPVPGLDLLVMAVCAFSVVLVGLSFASVMRRDVGVTYALVLYGIVVALFCARGFAAGHLDEAAVRTMMGYASAASAVFAVAFVAWALYKEVRLLQSWPEGRADELKCVCLVAAGVLTLVVAHMLSAAGPVVALAVATACYVALAVAGRMMSPKGLSCALLPLVVGATLGLITRADPGVLPPADMTDAMLALAQGPLKVLADGALPIVDGCSQLLGGLDPVLSLYVFLLVVSSLMGVGVSVLENRRPELVADAAAREAAADVRD